MGGLKAKVCVCVCRFANRVEFVSAVRELRLRELSCDHHMISVRCGLASIIPLQLLNIFTPLDLDLRVCGLPDISLDYLRVRQATNNRSLSCWASSCISSLYVPTEAHQVPRGSGRD